MIVDLSEVSLEVQFHSSSSKKSPLLILSHPHPQFGGTMENKVVDQIYRRSADRDWSVLRYNMRGVGKTSGTFDKGVGEEKDLLELIDWVAKQYGVDLDCILLIGYSFGSWLTAKVADQLQVPCILIAPPVTFYSFPPLDFPKQKIVFSAEKDELIPLEKVTSYFNSISEPKKYICIPEADHYFIGTTTQLTRKVFKVIEDLMLT